MFNLGIAAMRQVDYQRATALLDECVHVSLELANRWLYGATLAQLGITARYQGDDDRTTTFITQSLAIFREVGDKWSIAYALQRFGRDVALRQGHYDRAAASFRESLVLSREADNRWISEECIEGFARLASSKGRYEEAARLFGAAETQREIIGHRFAPPEQASHDERANCASTTIGEAAFKAAWAEGRAMTLEQAIEYALADEAN